MNAQHLRINEALKIMKGLNSLGINKDTCPDVNNLSEVINRWIKTGEFESGKILLPEINKKIIYKLMLHSNTVVKLVDL